MSDIYDAKWSRYYSWCRERGTDFFCSDAPQLADFFCYLFNDCGLAYSTVRGYKASILTVLESRGPVSVETKTSLGQLFSGFASLRPARRTPVPLWDLGLVLQILSAHPFEPLGTVSLEVLTYKTVFLIALASGARRGELSAL